MGKIMFIRVSTRCNAGCFMCKYSKNKYSYNISENQLKFILNYMKKDGNYKMVRFTGGEPLLHPKIEECISFFNKEGYKTSIITNGYLMPLKYKGLINAGLDQVIFSLDGSKSEIHNKSRGLEGLFNNLIKGIELVKEMKPEINVRVNTVASIYNIDDLLNILELLKKYKVNMWSIIPLKSSSISWNDGNVEYYIKKYYEFSNYVKKIDNPIFLGYSKQWGGRNKEEVEKLFYKNILYSPNTRCSTVDNISFYIPDLNQVIPCNCASHRIKQIETNLNSNSIRKNEECMRNWLKENGPKNCTGCEPLNVYLAENPNCLEKDIFLF